MEHDRVAPCDPTSHKKYWAIIHQILICVTHFEGFFPNSNQRSSDYHLHAETPAIPAVARPFMHHVTYAGRHAPFSGTSDARSAGRS
jgi:hypothetical protein